MAVALQVPKVVKRDGALVGWEPDRIRSAVTRAFRADMHQAESSPLAPETEVRIERVVS